MKTAFISLAVVVLAQFQSSCVRWPGPMPGSHAPALASDPDVKKAAGFACLTRSVSLLEITEASRQVVAGYNHRLRIKVLENGRQRKATAEVYTPLQGPPALTSWQWD